MKTVVVIAIGLLFLPGCRNRPAPEPQVSSVAAAAESGRDHFEQRIGHVVLEVSDLERSTAFYRDMLHLEVKEEAANEAERRVFLSGSEEHHELVLVKEKGPLAAWFTDRFSSETAVQQIAFGVGSHEALVSYVQKLQERDVPFELKDNQIAWSIYFLDPNNIQVEVYWDVRDQPFGKQQWQGEQAELSLERLMDPQGQA